MDRRSVKIFVVAITLCMTSACASVAPTPTVTPEPTITATPTQRPTATITPTPEPVNLSGTVVLITSTKKPFPARVELRQPEEFRILYSADTDKAGNFDLLNVNPGPYELWVLLTTRNKMIAGCTDVLSENEHWGFGVYFEGDKGMSLQNSPPMQWNSLGKVLMLLHELPAEQFPLEAIYLVDFSFIVQAGEPNQIEVDIQCYR